MAEAVILIGGMVIQTTNISEIQFNLDGFVVRFIANQKVIRHVKYLDFRIDDLTLSGSDVSAGYYEEKGFLSYLANHHLSELVKFTPANYGVAEASSDDVVKVEQLYVTFPYNPFYQISTSRFKKQPKAVDDKGVIIFPTNSADINVHILPSPDIFDTAQSFYTNRMTQVNSFPVDQRDIAAKYIIEMAIVIRMINVEVFNSFSDDPELSSYIITQNAEWAEGPILTSPSIDVYNLFLANLLAYYKIVYSNQIAIKTSPDDERLYYLALGLSHNTLTLLPVTVKCSLIEFVAKHKATDTFNKFQDEKLIVNLVSSFDETNITEADAFLTYLLLPLDRTSGETIYEILYRKMGSENRWDVGVINLTNWLLDTDFKPAKSKEYFIRAIYLLWQFSKYNPYDDAGEIKPHFFKFISTDPALANFAPNPSDDHGLFTYTLYTAYQQVNEPVYYEVKYPEAAPLILPYEFDKKLGFFFEDFSLNIVEEKIIVTQQVDVPNIRNTNNDQLYITRSFLYGTYDLYQPVALLNANTDSNLGITTVKGSTVTERGQNINAMIPVFVLEYIHANHERENVEAIIGYVLEVVAFYGEVVALSKLKYLRWIGVGADAAEVSAGIGVFTEEGLSVILGSVSFTNRVLNVFANFVECGPSDDFCHGMKKFIAILNLACATASAIQAGAEFTDSLANLAMRRQAAKVIEAAGGGATEALRIGNLETKLTALNLGEDSETILEVATVIHSAGELYYAPDEISDAELELVAEKISQRLQLENLRYFAAVRDSEVNVPTKTPPKFSLKKYATAGVQLFKNTGDDLHDDEELKELIFYGKSAGLGDTHAGITLNSATEGLIIRSYLVTNQLSVEEVEGQMNNYHAILTGTAVPYCFDNQSELNGFKDQFQILIGKYGLSDDIDNFVISGAALTQNPCPALELISYLKPEVINKHLDRFRLLFAQYTPKFSNKAGQAILKSLYDSSIHTTLTANCIIREESGAVFRLDHELKDLPTNMSGKAIDFKIYSTDETRNLPPEFTITF